MQLKKKTQKEERLCSRNKVLRLALFWFFALALLSPDDKEVPRSQDLHVKQEAETLFWEVSHVKNNRRQQSAEACAASTVPSEDKTSHAGAEDQKVSR